MVYLSGERIERKVKLVGGVCADPAKWKGARQGRERGKVGSAARKGARPGKEPRKPRKGYPRRRKRVDAELSEDSAHPAIFSAPRTGTEGGTYTEQMSSFRVSCVIPA